MCSDHDDDYVPSSKQLNLWLKKGGSSPVHTMCTEGEYADFVDYHLEDNDGFFAGSAAWTDAFTKWRFAIMQKKALAVLNEKIAEDEAAKQKQKKDDDKTQRKRKNDTNVDDRSPSSLPPCLFACVYSALA